MRSEGYGTWSVCLSACLSVHASSRTTGYEVAYEQLQGYESMKSERLK